MAIQRDSPYQNCNFLVDLGTGNTSGADAGFSEVLIPEGRIEVVEYRNGNDSENQVHKLPGLTRYGNVVLRRGLIGSLTLYAWWNDVRNGGSSTRNVTIHLMNEDHSALVMTWKLLRAWPTAYKGPCLKGKGQEVAIEELVLAFERLEME